MHIVLALIAFFLLFYFGTKKAIKNLDTYNEIMNSRHDDED